MLAELNGQADVGCVFHLTHLGDYAMSKLATLSNEQRQAVREFLLFLREAPDYEFDRPQIERALSEYWNNDETQPKS